MATPGKPGYQIERESIMGKHYEKVQFWVSINDKSEIMTGIAMHNLYSCYFAKSKRAACLSWNKLASFGYLDADCLCYARGFDSLPLC